MQYRVIIVVYSETYTTLNYYCNSTISFLQTVGT